MYDVVIKGGMVVDTKRCTCRIGNVGITADKITYTGNDEITGHREIDAAGKYVCPGFIDVHSHVDGDDYAGMLSACQGITTTVGGNCGLSPVDMPEWFESQDGGFFMNQLMFVGHSFSLREALDIVERARLEGIDVWIDSGMYTDWSTYIGTESHSPDVIRDNGYVLGDFIVADGAFAGRRMNQEIYTYLRAHAPEVSVICFTGKKEEIYMALNQPYAMPSTDAGVYAKGEGHPQIAGTYPKFFTEMVRERRDLDMATAVYKASALPAKLFGLENKGCIAPDMDADIVIVDLDRLKDRAAFPHIGAPDATPEGIDTVIVSGGIVVDDGVFTHTKSGRCMKI